MKKIFVITVICLLFGLTGCRQNEMTSIYNNEKKIAEVSNSFGYDDFQQEIDNNILSISYERLNGMDTVWLYEANEDMDLDITYQFIVSKGKAKLVHILPDNTNQIIVEKNKDTAATEKTSTIFLKKGTNRIKIVAADNADLKMEISIPAGAYEKMGM